MLPPRPAFKPLLVAVSDALETMLGTRLGCVVLFGSVARGTAGPSSDVDLLVVASGWEGGGASARRRELELVESLPAVQHELSALRSVGYDAELSFVAWTPGELYRFAFLQLDLVVDGQILLDRDGAFAARRAQIVRRMAELGTRRDMIGGAPCWNLKPDLRPGEVFELP